MTTSNEGGGSEKPLQATSQQNENEDLVEDQPEQKRMYWIDWCRSQSVWNVVCGHVWWTTKDTFRGFPVNVYRQPSNWNEQTRIIEYTVDQASRSRTWQF